MPNMVDVVFAVLVFVAWPSLDHFVLWPHSQRKLTSGEAGASRGGDGCSSEYARAALRGAGGRCDGVPPRTTASGGSDQVAPLDAGPPAVIHFPAEHAPKGGVALCARAA